MVILKVTKNRGISLPLKDTFLEKTTEGLVQIYPSRLRVK